MKTRTQGNDGFTLIELMVVIAVMSILMMIAVPSFRDASLSGQLRSSANDFVASANFARSEAIKRGNAVTVCVSTNGSSCGSGGWEQGWIVLSGTTVLQRQFAAPGGFKISATGGVASLGFQPIGVGATPATLTVCRSTPTSGSQERVVTLDAVGRAWVKTTTRGACS